MGKQWHNEDLSKGKDYTVVDSNMYSDGFLKVTVKKNDKFKGGMVYPDKYNSFKEAEQAAIEQALTKF